MKSEALFIENRLAVLIVVLIIGLAGLGIIFLPNKEATLGEAAFTSATNTVVKVGLNPSLSATLLAAGTAEYFVEACNYGIGNVTLCLASTCTYGSGILLSTTTDTCFRTEAPNLYNGAISAAVSATTTPSTTSTVGISYK